MIGPTDYELDGDDYLILEEYLSSRIPKDDQCWFQVWAREDYLKVHIVTTEPVTLPEGYSITEVVERDEVLTLKVIRHVPVEQRPLS